MEFQEADGALRLLSFDLQTGRGWFQVEWRTRNNNNKGALRTGEDEGDVISRTALLLLFIYSKHLKRSQ